MYTLSETSKIVNTQPPNHCSHDCVHDLFSVANSPSFFPAGMVEKFGNLETVWVPQKIEKLERIIMVYLRPQKFYKKIGSNVVHLLTT
jgi:hypothetical protein